MSNIPELFGCLVFDDDIMRARLPKEIYKAFRKTREDGKPLDHTVANSVSQCHEKLGGGTWSYPFYPLVPANDRHHCRQA